MRKYIIYMASGNASRFGRNKLLEPIHGKPLFQYGMDTLQAAASQTPDCHMVVVSRYPEIRLYAQSHHITAIDCPDSVKGASYTIRAGIKSLGDLRETDYLLFAVADQPYVRLASVAALLEKADGKTTTARLFYGQRPGNPVLFSGKLVPELLALQADQGGGRVVRRHPCIPVQVRDPRELADLDAAEDLAELIGI